MRTITTEEFENVLKDVRKSYRLLYLYQRRVMDLMKFIGDSLALNYEGGWSWFSNTSPSNGKGDLDKWAWDWLNMYFYEFHFSEVISSSKNIRFSVVLQSDTGYFDSSEENKLNIDSFENSDISETRLLFIIGKNAWHNDFSDFKKLNFKKNSEPYVRSNDKGIFLAKPFKLSKFINEDDTRKCLKEIVAFVNINGIKEITLIN